jgi:hypothetical protein
MDYFSKEEKKYVILNHRAKKMRESYSIYFCRYNLKVNRQD